MRDVQLEQEKLLAQLRTQKNDILIRVARKFVELDIGTLTGADVNNVCVALVRQELAANAEAVGIARRVIDCGRMESECCFGSTN